MLCSPFWHKTEDPSLVPKSFCAVQQTAFDWLITKLCWQRSGRVEDVATPTDVVNAKPGAGPKRPQRWASRYRAKQPTASCHERRRRQAARTHCYLKRPAKTHCYLQQAHYFDSLTCLHGLSAIMDTPLRVIYEALMGKPRTDQPSTSQEHEPASIRSTRGRESSHPTSITPVRPASKCFWTAASHSP